MLGGAKLGMNELDGGISQQERSVILIPYQLETKTRINSYSQTNQESIRHYHKEICLCPLFGEISIKECPCHLKAEITAVYRVIRHIIHLRFDIVIADSQVGFA